MNHSAKSSAIDKAISLHQDGCLEDADKLYARILRNKPNHTQALHLRGVLKQQQGEHTLAEHLLNKALRSSADDPWINFHLGQVLAASERHKPAVKQYKIAIENGVKDADVFFMFANSLFELQCFPEAISNYQNALALRPGDGDCRLNLANALEAAGDLTQAIATLEPLVSASDAPAAFQLQLQLQLVELLTNAGQALKAHTLLAKIEQADKNDVDQILGCARQMHRKVRYDSCVHLLNLVLPYIATLDQRQFDLTIGLLNDLGCYNASSQLLGKLDTNVSRSAWSWFQQGLCEQVAGEFQSATGCHQNALQLDSTLGAAAYSIASNGNTVIDSDTLENWISKKNDSSIPAPRRAQFAFAAAKVHDKNRAYDTAFETYLQANQLIAKEQPFDAEKWDAYTDSIIATFDTHYFEHQQDLMKTEALAGETAGEHLIFIVGMPRSGSTLLEQTLKREIGITGLGEHHALRRIAADIPEVTGFAQAAPQCALDLSGDDLAAFRQRYLQSLTPFRLSTTEAGASAAITAGSDRYIDKMLGNFVRLGILAGMFPQARILHSCRDPMATGVSCFTNAFSSGLKFSYDLYAMGRAWHSYQRLMQHWHAVLPLQMMDVHYEKLVTDPQRYQKEIIQFLGCPSASNPDNKPADNPPPLPANDTINTASFWQARQPISTSSIAAWKRFDTYLDPLRDGLAQKAQ